MISVITQHIAKYLNIKEAFKLSVVNHAYHVDMQPIKMTYVARVLKFYKPSTLRYTPCGQCSKYAEEYDLYESLATERIVCFEHAYKQLCTVCDDHFSRKSHLTTCPFWSLLCSRCGWEHCQCNGEKNSYHINCNGCGYDYYRCKNSPCSRCGKAACDCGGNCKRFYNRGKLMQDQPPKLL